MTTADLATRLSLLLSAPIVEHNAEEIPGEGFVVERIEDAAHVLFDGATVGLADPDPLTFSLTLEARWESITLYDEADAAEMVMADIRIPWEARGWVVDEESEPGNGWDAEDRVYILNLVKDLETIEDVVAEVRFAVEEGTVAWIEDVAGDDAAALAAEAAAAAEGDDSPEPADA